jgi:hypothetical protein
MMSSVSYLKEMHWSDPVVLVALGGHGRIVRLEFKGVHSCCNFFGCIDPSC